VTAAQTAEKNSGGYFLPRSIYTLHWSVHYIVIKKLPQNVVVNNAPKTIGS